MDESSNGATQSAEWCILRTTGGRTVSLARSLERAGIEAWTPIEQQSKRRPRSKVRFEVVAPIMPTFVFVRAGHLPELARCLAEPVNPHPSFSIFRHGGRIPIIADADIAGLRVAEESAKRRADRARMKAHRHVFPVGEQVRLDEGAFAGMSGVVEGGDGKFALVAFNGGLSVKIATFLLRPENVEHMKPISGTVAEAA